MALILNGDTGHVIQLAVAPAFVLAAIGTTITVLTNRLARVNDRAHLCKDELSKQTTVEQAETEREFRTLLTRARLLNGGVTSAGLSALMVCVLVISLFVGNELEMPLDRPIAALFVLAMLSLIATYAFLLVEVYVAERSFSI